MNTTQKGNEFEEKSYRIIQNSLNLGELGIISNQCRVFRKKGYYSHQRKGDIIFDLTIEVWPPDAERYILLYIIECKNYSHSIPVNDIEEFHNKIQQVSGVNVKGVFITNNEFQSGAYTVANSLGMMLMQVNYDESYKILLHKIHRNPENINNKTKVKSWDDTIIDFFNDAFNLHSKIRGLKKLSSENIEAISLKVLNELDPNINMGYESVNIQRLIEFVEKRYSLGVDCTQSLNVDINGNLILGYYSRSEKKIYIERTIVDTPRFAFIFAHELGHFILHEDLKINQNTYDSFSDSEFNFLIDKYELKNEKHWIEWQANKFAATLIVPRKSLLAHVMAYQKQNGIRNVGKIYHDNQPVNENDYNNIVNVLSDFYQVTKTSIIFRLRECDILIEPKILPNHISRHFFDY